MKQKWIIKIILILAIILIAGLLKTTSLAEFTEGSFNTIISGGSAAITRNDLMTSKYIFCRDKGNPLIDERPYYLDNTVRLNPANYPIITYYKGEEYTGGTTSDISEAKSVKVEGADIAYVFSKFDNTKPSSGYSYIQWAYWAVLGQVPTEQLDPNALRIIS